MAHTASTKLTEYALSSLYALSIRLTLNQIVQLGNLLYEPFQKAYSEFSFWCDIWFRSESIEFRYFITALHLSSWSNRVALLVPLNSVLWSVIHVIVFPAADLGNAVPLTHFLEH